MDLPTHCNIDRPELPPLEVDLLLATVDEALDLAHAKRVEDGYQELVYGRERMEAHLEAGEPWAPELLERWKKACINYGFTYRVFQPEALGSDTRSEAPPEAREGP